MKIVLRKIGKNEYVFSMLTRVLTVLFGLLQQIILARYLGSSLKGEVSYIQNLVGVWSIIVMVGLHHSYPVLRRASDFSEEKRNEFLSGCLIYFLICAMVGVLLIGSFSNDVSNQITHILSIIVAHSTVVGYVYLIEEPNRRNWEILLFSSLDFLFYIFICINIEPTFEVGLLLIYIVEGLKAIYFTIKLKYHFVFSIDTLVLLKKQLGLGFFPMISLLLTNLNYKLDILMLSNSHLVTKSDIGVYSVAIGIAEKALLLPDAMKEILLSKLSKGASAREVMKINRVAIWVTAFTALIIALFCEPVVNLLFGEDYLEATNIIRITTFGTVFMVIFKMVGSYNIVMKKQKINVALLSISVVVNILLNTLLIPRYGIYGAAYATIIGFFVCGICFGIYFCITEKITISSLIILSRDDLRTILRFLKKDV